MGNNQGTQKDLEPMVKYSGMTVKHVLLLRERLEMLSEADLSITKESFTLAMKTKETETDRVFRIFDLSGSGKIETLEFVCALSLLSYASLRDKCDLIFGLYDFDKNRTMNKQELVILIKTVLTTINAISSKGECTIQEALQYANTILDRYDTNGDASISQKEFYSFVSKDPDILKILLSYGLISLQDLRFNFGEPPQGLPLPEADSDLEEEIYKSKQIISQQEEMINLGLEPEQAADKPPKQQLPWMKTVQTFQATNYIAQPNDVNPPNATLEMDYVYGSRCFDTRNNVKFSSDGELVYHQGAIGVVLNTTTNKQRFYLEHTDDITCLDVFESTVASGQMGNNPVILVWDARTLETKAVCKGVLTIGISNLTFSNDGRKLAAIGMDEDQCVAIYDLERSFQSRLNGRRDDSLLTSVKGPVTEIFDVRFEKNDKTVVIACMGEVNFLSYENNYKLIRATWDAKQCPIQAILSIGVLENAVVVGTFKGQLLQWRGSRSTMAIEAHKGAVTCIHSQKLGVLSGGKDGVICWWDYNLKILKKLNLADQGLLNHKIMALCETEDSSRLAVSTRGGQLLEIIGKQIIVRVSGHFNGSLTALVTHPTFDWFYTAGEDQMLICWNAAEKRINQFLKLDYVCYSLDASDRYLVCGCSNGNILVLDPNNFGTLFEFKDRDSAVSCVKLSPELDYLIVYYTSPYSEFFVYLAKQKFKKVTSIPGKQGRCKSIDFSPTRRVQVTFTSGELMFINMENMTSYRTYYDEPWITHNSTYGWPVQGVWPKWSDGTEIMSVDRAKEIEVLAVADRYASVKLYRYPAYLDDQSFYKYYGHSSQVTAVRFTKGDRYLISVGGAEKSVVQWKFQIEASTNEEVVLENKPPVKKPNEVEADQEQNEGTQQSQTKPYLDIMKFEESHSQNQVPPQYLNLRYIFGVNTTYDNQPLYNVIKYTANSRLVYPAGGVGIVQETKIDQTAPFRKQTYYFGHTQEITALAIHPKGQLAATGTCGNEIKVWDVDSKYTLIEISGYHKNGIYKLRFSIDGTLLLTIGKDKFNSLAIYDWQSNRMVCTSKIDREPIDDICFFSIPGQVVFASSGSFLRVWQMRGRNLSFDQYSGRGTAVTFAFNSEIIQGNLQGELVMWKGKQPNKVIGHNGRVNVLLSFKQNLFSCGDDGKIVLWHFQQNQLQQAQVVIDSSNPILSLDAKNENVIFINSLREIKEVITAGQVRSNDLIRCSSAEITGLAVYKNKFITCGLDCFARVWELKNRIILQQLEFKHPLGACDWNGNLIILADHKCQLHLLSERLDVLQTVPTKFKSSQFKLSEVRFTPDGLKVACGASGGPSPVEIWTINNQRLEKQLIVSVGFTSGLSRLDWAVDNQFIVAASENYELKCVSVSKQRDVQYNYDVKWASWSCQFGPCVQSIYPYKQGEDITSVQVCREKGFLLAGDRFGTLGLFYNPAHSNWSRKYPGHCGPITRIKFILDDTYAITAGNSLLMIWQIDQDIPNEIPEDLEKLTSNLSFPIVQPKKVGFEKFGKQLNLQEPDQMEEEELQGQSQRSIFARPWTSNIKEPSSYYKDPINQANPPLIDLEIEYAFGYRGNDCKNNLRFLKNGSILYHTASLAIVLDQTVNEQKIFDLHEDDIISLDLHPDGIRVATGDLAQAVIYVWDSNTMQPLCLLQALTDGIQSLHFSPAGDKLLALGQDSQNTLAIFDINTKSPSGGSLIQKFSTGLAKIYEARWITDTQFYTIGPYHLKEWTLMNPLSVSTLTVNTILYTFATCDQTLYIADHEGRLLVYEEKQLTNSLHNHTQCIESIQILKDYVITASKDQLIHVQDRKNLRADIILTLKLTDYVKLAFCPQIKSAQFNPGEMKFIVGTFGCEIWELSSKDPKLNSLTKFTHKIVMKGHYAPSAKSELWGLAVDGDFVYTCGDDATLRQWSISQKRQVTLIKTNQDNNYNEIKPDENGVYPDSVKGRCIAISPEVLLMGFKDGGLRIYDRDLKQKAYLKVAKEWISEIKFSPNYEIVAVGSHDNSIYLFNYPEMTPYLKPLRKHSEFIKNFDFSMDGTKLMSTCGGFDLIFWDLKTGKQLPQGRAQLRDEPWYTYTNTFGWAVQGIWKDSYEGTEINCVTRSYQPFAKNSPDNYYLLAVGNDFNEIQIYRYPCVQRSAASVKRRGHSSPVAQVKFTQDDKYLVTLGGEDMTLIVWRIVKRL